jgi:hypothetical protein
VRGLGGARMAEGEPGVVPPAVGRSPSERFGISRSGQRAVQDPVDGEFGHNDVGRDARWVEHQPLDFGAASLAFP